MPVIITDNIELECINLISMYKDVNYVKEILHNYHPQIKDTKLKRVSSRIVSYISQGLELLDETDNKIQVASLTLFYSISNFAKAVYYLHYPDEELKGSHGLDVDNSTAKNQTDMGKVTVKVENGAFLGLVKVTGDNLKSGDRLLCKDIISIVPELCGIYAMRYLQEANVYLMEPFQSNVSGYYVVSQTKNEDEIKNIDYTLPGLNKLLISCYSADASGVFASCFKSEACDDVLFEKATYKDIFGNRYLTSGIKNGDCRIKLSKICSLYICYFLFSFLTRYYAEEWMNICKGADSAIVYKMISLRKEMLLEILQLLSKAEYSFRTRIETRETDMDIDKLWDDLKGAIQKDKYISGKNPLSFLE